jgi:hypothetical protein
MYPVLDLSSFAPYSRFPTELASILLLVFSLFALAATLVCIQKAIIYQLNLTIFMYVTQIQYSVLAVISHNRSKVWNVLLVDMGALLHSLFITSPFHMKLFVKNIPAKTKI